MKVIFVDFDGVLNSDKYVANCGYYGVVIDPSKMVLLKNITESTGAKIVLSTSWREHWNKDDSLCDETGKLINSIFSQYGLEIYDKTPKLYMRRETEIKSWLDINSGVEKFVVLDDAFLNADFMNDFFIKTSNLHGGLDENDAAKAIKILNE